MDYEAEDLEDLVRRAYRFAYSLTRHHARAEDLAQTAWHSVIRAGGPLNRGYVFTAIRRQFIDDLRRRRVVLSAPADDPACEDCEASLWGEVDERVSSNGAFQRALDGLRPEERAVLYLAFVEGFTAQRIADLFEFPRGSVLSLMSRARKKIRDAVIDSDEA
jgi:RNA polymerase sigma-70 factor (ECF subfamily)